MAASGLVCGPSSALPSPVLEGCHHKRTRSMEGDIQIYLAILGSRSGVMPMRVLISDTIASVKMRIQKCRGFFTSQQRLVHAGRELVRDDVLLKDYGVSNGEVVHLVLRLLDVIDVTVKTVSGKEYVFQVWRSNRVKDLKQRISKEEGGLALDRQQLIFNGKQLEDHERIEGLSHSEDVVIHLVVRRTAKIRSKSVGADIELSITSSELDSVVEKRLPGPGVASSVESGKKTPPLPPPVRGERDFVRSNNDQIWNGVVRDSFIEPVNKTIISDSLAHVLRGARAGLEEGHAPVLSAEGSGGTYFLKDSAGKNVGVFKPSDEEPMAVNNPRAGISSSVSLEGLKRGIRVGEGAIREVAAYILDHPATGPSRDAKTLNEEGFANVPPTMMVRASHKAFNNSSGDKVGSLQQFVTSFSNCEDMGPEKFPVQEVHKISVLDLRLANTDRNGGNILVCKEDSSYKLVPIDHGYCIPDKFEDCTFEWLYWPQARVPFSPATLEYISKLDADWDISVLAAHGWILSPECARVLRIATMLLKKGAASGLSPFEIGSIMSREKFDEKSVIELMLEQAETELARSFKVTENAFMDIVSNIIDKYMQRTVAKVV